MAHCGENSIDGEGANGCAVREQERRCHISYDSSMFECGPLIENSPRSTPRYLNCLDCFLSVPGGGSGLFRCYGSRYSSVVSFGVCATTPVGFNDLSQWSHCTDETTAPCRPKRNSGWRSIVRILLLNNNVELVVVFRIPWTNCDCAKQFYCNSNTSTRRAVELLLLQDSTKDASNNDEDNDDTLSFIQEQLRTGA